MCNGKCSCGDERVEFIDVERGVVLIEALQTINGERQDCYGNPEDSFELIAAFWSVYLRDKLRIHIHKHDVAMMMSLFKTARIKHGNRHKDSYVDLCGYTALAADMVGASMKQIECGDGDKDRS